MKVERMYGDAHHSRQSEVDRLIMQGEGATHAMPVPDSKGADA